MYTIINLWIFIVDARVIVKQTEKRIHIILRSYASCNCFNIWENRLEYQKYCLNTLNFKKVIVIEPIKEMTRKPSVQLFLLS